MKKISTFALSLLFAIIGTVQASAETQYTINASQYIMANYKALEYPFSLTEVATALGTDAATLAADFSAEVWTTDYITLESDGGSTNYTLGANGGYWMTADGQLSEWGAGGVWYNETWCDLDANTFVFSIGQMPDGVAVGDKLHAVFGLNYNDKKVTFDVSIAIVEKPEINVETVLSKLNILGTVEGSTTQAPRSNYNADEVTIDLTEAVTGLGFTDLDFLSLDFGSFLYMGQVDPNLLTKKDSLTNKWTASSGFWTELLYDEDTDSYPGELVSADYSSNCAVYIEAFNFDPATKQLTCNVGQYPGAVGYDQHYWIPLYLINGSNAYIIRVNFNTTEYTEIPFESKTKVGEIDVTVTMPPSTNYATKKASIDVESLIALLGCTEDEMKFYAESAEGVLSDNRTANNDGYWLDHDGFVCTWGTDNCSFCVELPDGFSVLSFCHFPDHLAEGDVRTASFYYTGPETYVKVNFTLNITAKEIIDLSEYKFVAYDAYEYQIVPNAQDYQDAHMAEGFYVDAARIAELLGEGEYTFLGEELDSTMVLISDAYSCDPHPGFWMEGNYVSTWGSSCSYGIAYDLTEGRYDFFQYPGAREVGDSYCSNFYIVNPATKKAIKHTFTVEYVSEIATYVTVGTEQQVLPIWNAETEDYIETPVDLTACYTALGCDAEMFEAAGSWKTISSTGKCSEFGYQNEMYGFWFDANGYPTETEEEMVFSAEFLPAAKADCGKDCFRTSAFAGGTYSTKLVAEYDMNRYFFNIIVTTDPTSITTPETVKAEGKAFNVMGMRVNPATARGIVIVDGKKYIRK